MKTNYKKISKNALFLYFRMILITLVSFYTIRVILEVLGITDYGIYNIVSSLIIMMAFLNGMLSASSLRFLTYEIGNDNFENLKKTFSTSILIHSLLAIIVFVLAETFGLYFFYNSINIPIDRMDAAFWVYQVSIIVFIISIIQVPYYSLIIAHEEMKVFAYISILEAILKLLVVYLLIIIPSDKLVTYSILILLVAFCIFFFYKTYTNKKYKESKFSFIFEKVIFKNMLNFSGWSLCGSLGSTLSIQGINILLNIFFGPIVNAAYAIAMQIYAGMLQFINSFQNAITPQLTKLYAKNNIEELNNLIYENCKFAYLLALILALPLLLELDYVLSIWLVEIPEYTYSFSFLLIIYGVLYSLLRPLVMAVHATGRLKYVQISVGILLISNLPISYILLKNDFPAYSPLAVGITIWFFHFGVKLYFLRKYINLSLVIFFRKTILPIIIITSFSSLILFYVSSNFEDSLIKLFLIIFLSVITITILSYIFAINKEKKIFLKDFMKTKLRGKNEQSI